MRYKWEVFFGPLHRIECVLCSNYRLPSMVMAPNHPLTCIVSNVPLAELEAARRSADPRSVLISALPTCAQSEVIRAI